MPSPRYRVTPTTVPIERDPGSAGPTTTPVRVDMTTWTDRAACSTRPDWDRQSIPERIAICQTCPVVTECTTLAIDMLQQDHALRRVHDIVYGGEVLRDLWQRIKPPGHSRTASARIIGPTARTKARLQQVIAMHADGATPEEIAATVGVSTGTIRDRLIRWMPEQADLARVFGAARERARRRQQREAAA